MPTCSTSPASRRSRPKYQLPSDHAICFFPELGSSPAPLPFPLLLSAPTPEPGLTHVHRPDAGAWPRGLVTL